MFHTTPALNYADELFAIRQHDAARPQFLPVGSKKIPRVLDELVYWHGTNRASIRGNPTCISGGKTRA